VNRFGKRGGHWEDETNQFRVLINPCNPQLSGVSKFPYFPRGGPVPKDYVKGRSKDWQPLGYVSSWGGMDVGSGMMYPVSVVDGLVHQLGGYKLALECAMAPTVSKQHEGRFTKLWNSLFNSDSSDEIKCNVGSAIRTGPGSNVLKQEYDAIIHTVPPFYKYPDKNEKREPNEILKQCYRASLSLVEDEAGSVVIAAPILGAGARGFPVDVALKIAAAESIQWMEESRNGNQKTLAFGIPDVRVSGCFVRAIQNAEV